MIAVLQSLLVISIILGIIYWRMGYGLAFRIYLLIMPITTMTYMVGVASSSTTMKGTLYNVISTALGVVIVAGLAYLYRMTVKPLREYSRNLQSSGAQLTATATQSASTAAEQSSVAAQVSATTEEITKTSAAAAENAQGIVEVAANALEKSQQGEAAVKKVLDILNRIGRINHIVDSINTLADQSEILAVNAGIEAAKAGEQGRGFAVVAAEVRSLAQKSSKATQEIRNTIELTTEGQTAAATAAEVIKALTVVLEDASDRSRQIAGTVLQQSSGVKQISEATHTLSQASQDNATATKDIEQASADLTAIGLQLRQFIGGR